MRSIIFCLLLLCMLPAAAQHFLIPSSELSDRIKEFSSKANKAFYVDFLSARLEERTGPKKQLDKYHIVVYKEKIDNVFRLHMLFNDTAILSQLKHVPDSGIIGDILMPDIAESFAYQVIKRDTVHHNDTIAITVRLGNGSNYLRQFSVKQVMDKAESRISFEDERMVGGILSTLLHPHTGQNYDATGMNAWNTGACPSCISFYGGINFLKPADKKEQQALYDKVKGLFNAGRHPNLSYRWKCTSFKLERSDSSYIEFRGAITLIRNPLQ